MEANSALSDTQREPPAHAGPLHHPAQVSLVPVAKKKTKKQIYKAIIHSMDTKLCILKNYQNIHMLVSNYEVWFR